MPLGTTDAPGGVSLELVSERPGIRNLSPQQMGCLCLESPFPEPVSLSSP